MPNLDTVFTSQVDGTTLLSEVEHNTLTHPVDQHEASSCTEPQVTYVHGLAPTGACQPLGGIEWHCHLETKHDCGDVERHAPCTSCQAVHTFLAVSDGVLSHSTSC